MSELTQLQLRRQNMQKALDAVKDALNADWDNLVTIFVYDTGDFGRKAKLVNTKTGDSELVMPFATKEEIHVMAKKMNGDRTGFRIITV